MSDIYPLVVVLDRYNGTFSGGKWTAWNLCYVPSKIFDDDNECSDFFSKNTIVYGRGETPQEAIEDLKMILDCGISDPGEEDEDDDEEEEKMEPTSVWKIENIDKIWITQDGDEISLLLKNRDDLTKIILVGEAIKNHNDNFITTLKVDLEENEKEFSKQDQKIRELEKELNQVKQKNKAFKDTADTWSKEYYNLSKKFDKLQEENEKMKDKLENIEPFRSLERTIKEKQQLKEEYEGKIDVLQRKYNLEKAANEASHKFFKQYAGKGTEIEFNYAIGDGDEVTYVILDKKEYEEKIKKLERDDMLDKEAADYWSKEYDILRERFAKLDKEYQNLKEGGCSVMIHDKIYNHVQLMDRIKELEALKTPTIENFSDEEPSSRRDILRRAEKCVCGKREQDYGTPESNFQLIADLWNGYLGGKTDNPVISVTPVDVSMMMALMKIARIRNGGGSGDSFVDLAGYAACGGEIWASNKETNGDSSQDTN